jgi:hypothetical protein
LLRWAVLLAVVSAGALASSSAAAVESRKQGVAHRKKPATSAPVVPTSELASEVAAALGEPAVSDLPQQPEEQGPEPVAMGTPERDVAQDRAALERSRGVDTSIAVVEARAGAFARWFKYKDALGQSLRDYQLGGAPLAGVHVELFPLARTRTFLRALGMGGGYSRSIGVSSAFSDGVVGTTFERFDVDLRWRQSLGDRVTLVGALAYERSTFTFDETVPAWLATQTPDTRTESGVAKLDARVAVLPWVHGLAGVRGGFAIPSAPLSSRFPHGHAGVVGVELGAAFPLVRGVELRGSVTYSRYFYSFAPDPGSPYVAGGALDEYGGANGSLAIWL